MKTLNTNNSLPFFSLSQVDIRIAMVISLTVICACVVAGVAIVVCCFVSPCPLYDACSGSGGWKNPTDVGYVIGDSNTISQF